MLRNKDGTQDKYNFTEPWPTTNKIIITFPYKIFQAASHETRKSGIILLNDSTLATYGPIHDTNGKATN